VKLARGAGAALLMVLTACRAQPPNEVAEGEWGNATVVEELSIGVDLGADEYMFGRLWDIAVADDGTIYAADGDPIVVRVFDRDGNFLRNIGREGQGPGEFGAFPMLEVLSDGRLAAWDYGNSRLSLLAPDGNLLGSFPGPAGTNRLHAGPADDLYIGAFEPGSRLERVVVVRFSIEGEEIERIPLPADDPAGRSVHLSSEGVSSFGVRTYATFSPLGYVVTGRNDVYDIELRKPEGTVHLRREIPAITLGSEEHQDWEAFRNAYLRLFPPSDSRPGPHPIPDTKPYFRAIEVGDDGRVWVWRYVAAEKRDDVEPLPDGPDRPLLTWREPWTYDVFEPDGTFLGSVLVPELFRPFVFRGDQIWGVLPDPEGVERLVRLRVVPEGGGQ
jgi:hypothetical protein